ncbi:Phosphate transport system permease protein PstA [Kiritimatiella glycovorans]|uniref:Phosphate transport system permease protein PstA n=2 Tax=Kiritimatiella glycovorans TaxID=1307763 RepID=A0A0G3EBA4_9BACT|nr:Phosphate transport system permease protein PstA [Kiritimatiella glycovorans]
MDRAFSGVGLFSILVMGLFLLFVLGPIIGRGISAYVFRGTIEHRRFLLENFERGDSSRFEREMQAVREARRPVFRHLREFEAAMDESRELRSEYRRSFRELEEAVHHLIGPDPEDKAPVLVRKKYGATRLDQARTHLFEAMHEERWVPDPDNPGGALIRTHTPRGEHFAGTRLEPLFPYLEEHFEAMLQPGWTFYWRFLTDRSIDSHFFGGIGPEVLGTLYLTLGAMLFAMPMGIIAAIYLCEYARPGRVINLIRTCISTLAGVPSIVFGLFGLAFFLNTLQVTQTKSVLAGSLTLALMILPTVIRASEEAILAVPAAYKEAALSLGAGRWHTICTVILPAALPGILTGVVISMGRAAGETAPIIFTAAVSMGEPLQLFDAFSQPTPALPWNIYNLATEHEAVDQIRHVQYGMVFTLVAIVLILNITAIAIRARISSRLKG